ncbi:MAG: AI-2E family transporter [Anaerolineales bacterium]|nr:AI-2E family transporter [Anaerolineales bacterium]
MSETAPQNVSPGWGATTKLIVGLTLVAIVAAALVKFNNIIAPLILTFILSYVLHPMIAALNRSTRLSWQASVNIAFLLLVILIIGSLTVTGVTVVQQMERLINIISDFITELPDLLESWTANPIFLGPVGPFGPWEIDIPSYLNNLNIDFLQLSQQVLGVVQPVVGQAGGLIGSVAASTAVTLGWGALILIISYFILVEAGESPDFLGDIEFTGYLADLRRLGRELGHIWNVFLRGQLVIILLATITNFTVMSILGVRTAYAIALVVGAARFVPYVGPWIAATVIAVVTFFQPANYLGLAPIWYAILAVGIAMILDTIFDNIISPRIFGSSLGVHPAAVLLSAIVLASLIGIIGLLLAAPVLASVQLVGGYTLRKMFDLDPFPDPEDDDEDVLSFKALKAFLARLWARVQQNKIFQKVFRRGKKND